MLPPTRTRIRFTVFPGRSRIKCECYGKCSCGTRRRAKSVPSSTSPSGSSVARPSSSARTAGRWSPPRREAGSISGTWRRTSSAIPSRDTRSASAAWPSARTAGRWRAAVRGPSRCGRRTPTSGVGGVPRSPRIVPGDDLAIPRDNDAMLTAAETVLLPRLRADRRAWTVVDLRNPDQPSARAVFLRAWAVGGCVRRPLPDTPADLLANLGGQAVIVLTGPTPPERPPLPSDAFRVTDRGGRLFHGGRPLDELPPPEDRTGST